MRLSNDGMMKTETAGGPNGTVMIGEAISKTGNVAYADYQYYQEPPPIANLNPTTSQWNATNNIAFYEYGDNNGVNVNSVRNYSKLNSRADARGRSIVFNEKPSATERNIDSITNTNRSEIKNTNFTYMDEWQAVAEKLNDVTSSKQSARVELRRAKSHSRDVPLLRGI